jgi:hypothetical protein
MIDRNCDQMRDLLAAYSIGATDPAESQQVEIALADCPELRAELADYQGLAEALHHAVPLRHSAPAAERILGPILRGETPTTTQPQPTLRSEKVIPLPPKPRRQVWWISIAALFVVTVLAVGSNLYWSDQVQALRAAQQDLITQINQAATPVQALPVSLRREDSHHRRLTATTTNQPGAQAEVIWNSHIEVGALYATGLAQLPPDMAYQLWGVRGQMATSLGQFSVDENGTGFLIFQSPEPIVSFDALGISPEPASGSQQPTHDHVVVGKI